jgi:hypothetical protein
MALCNLILAVSAPPLKPAKNDYRTRVIESFEGLADGIAQIGLPFGKPTQFHETIVIRNRCERFDRFGHRC